MANPHIQSAEFQPKTEAIICKSIIMCNFSKHQLIVGNQNLYLYDLQLNQVNISDVSMGLKFTGPYNDFFHILFSILVQKEERINYDFYLMLLHV